MYRDEFAYFLTATDIRPEATETLTEMMRSEKFFDGRLTPEQDSNDITAKQITFTCGNLGSITGLDRDEIDQTMHILAQSFPEATFLLSAENVDNTIEKFEIKTHGDLYSCSELQHYMPELPDMVPFDQRRMAQEATAKQPFLEQFLHNTDFDLLYQQKQALLQTLMQKQLPDPETLEGLINFLDFIGDWAEQEGLFRYPDMEQSSQQNNNQKETLSTMISSAANRASITSSGKKTEPSHQIT